MEVGLYAGKTAVLPYVALLLVAVALAWTGRQLARLALTAVEKSKRPEVVFGHAARLAGSVALALVSGLFLWLR